MEYRHLFIVIIVLWESQGSSAEPTVVINDGVISGTETLTRNGRRVFAFRGIPYGKAPIGPFRFRNPEPVEPWSGTFYADRDPDPCPQINDDGVAVGDEDCLKLNVYTPKTDGDLLPVMVYVHGGEFVRGDTYMASVGPGFLLDYDVLLVAMQYRLGVLGFISTGDKTAPGNIGLKDQVLALRWVQDNIRNFGGDPDRVTLFGQSAGAASVNLHVLSNLSKGLFHQFITQSGSALCPWAFEDSTTYKDYSFALGEDFGCPTNSSEDLISCLRSVDLWDLVTNYDPFAPFRRETTITWMPTREPDIEGAFLTDLPIHLILGSKMQDLPNISGVVKDDGLILTIFLHANATLYDSLLGDLDSLFTHISSSYFSDSRAATLATSVQDFYFSGIDVKNKTQVLATITDIISDSSFIFPQVLQLQLATKKMKSPYYYYNFAYRGTFSRTSSFLKNNENIGVSHSDDLIYIFPSNSSSFGIDEDSLSDEDHKMVDIVTELWTSFAINGVPTTSYASPPDLWETYNDRTNTRLLIGSGSKATVEILEDFLEPRMHFWAMQILKMVFFSG
ncbi:juvenile hormone esterase-like [Diachasmimorpha longicaudata]|uniref:juvenile hormone esterase-like n=1 Tax=Diachasmimorpha longicaudata TaxID=58733 RepID=UPI0030B89CF1